MKVSIRKIKSTPLGMLVLMATLTVFNIVDRGVLGDAWLGDILALISFTSLVALGAGWIFKSPRMSEIGLLFAFIAYALRMFFVLFTEGPFIQAVYFSLGAAIISGGAYRSEVRARLRAVRSG